MNSYEKKDTKKHKGSFISMKKLRVSVLGLLLCGFIIIPVQFAKADGGLGDVAPDTAPHGSGSYQLNSVGEHYRFYTEYFVEADTANGKSIQSAGIDRRTSINVYAKPGEVILFGSSVSNSQIDKDNHYRRNVTGADIVITTPSGEKIPFDVLAPYETEENGTLRPNGLGYIKNYKQEKNGPMVNYADEQNADDYYVPLQYPVPNDAEAGVYTFEFHSVTGYNPNGGSGYHPSPKKARFEWSQGNTSVAAWDVTVLGKKSETEWEVKSGRAWADYLALTTAGDAAVTSDMNVYVLAHDGYQYRVNFTEAAPYGFIFFANNTGFMSAVSDGTTTTYRPIYHSFYDASNDLVGMTSEENIYLHKPDVADTATEETYKIFFNAPSADLNGFTYTRYGIDDTIKTAPDETVTISDLKFLGYGNRENMTIAGQGGYFTFQSTGEAIVTIRLDLRKAIFESQDTMGTYTGSGLVEVTAPAVRTVDEGGNMGTPNRVYWDGKDTDGIELPAGIFGNGNVVISSEVKRGELHFPVIDMEGLYGGLTVKRVNGNEADISVDDPERYDLYYNNNPLAYGSIEGKASDGRVYNQVKSDDGKYYVLSDGTNSRSLSYASYFSSGQSSISTLKQDDREYLAKKLFDMPYASLDATSKAIIDAEFQPGHALTFHHEAINSSIVKMKFDAEKYAGGGNNAGIDAWTYYSSGINALPPISFAVMANENRGVVKGQIFYDTHTGTYKLPNSKFDGEDYWLPGIKVRLVKSNGEPLIHKEKIPQFDDTGHFLYDDHGKIVFEETDVEYEAVTDSTGTYRFTGVPYSADENTTYYLQVMLTDVQSEVLRYACTTSKYVQEQFISGDNKAFLESVIDTDSYGADGNEIIEARTSNGGWDDSKIYRHKYARNESNETVFVGVGLPDEYKYAQSVTFKYDEGLASGELYKTATFKPVGFSSTVPSANQKDYVVKKEWGKDSQGNDHNISDGLIVELWVWNDDKVNEVNAEEHKVTRRTGALVGTQILNDENSWTCEWKKLDDRLQYYVLEYYTKKKANGEVMYNDNGEPRKILIGGTMPIFSSNIPTDNIYGFTVQLGDYPDSELIPDPDDSSKKRIKIQKFGDVDESGNPLIHANALTNQEKLESVDTNARQYNVSYTLTRDAGETKNIITLTNSQEYDDRAYYVWFGHETVLPEMIALTYVDTENGVSIKKSHAVTLVPDTAKEPLGDGLYPIKGLSVSSMDAAQNSNAEGNATKAFKVKNDGNASTSALFTATDETYKTGVGTRTYRVKYAVKKPDNPSEMAEPVSIEVGEHGNLIETETGSNINIEESDDYIVYSWYMTIHVYDVNPDEFEYDPAEGTITLQESLKIDEEKHELEGLTWQLDIGEDNVVSYTSNDYRTGGILSNDTYRVPLYKHAVHPDMGSCADIVGIAWLEDEASNLKYSDTYESRYGSQVVNEEEELEEIAEDGTAIAYGSGGFVTVSLTEQRYNRIDRTQDHANYAKVTFTPYQTRMARSVGPQEDIFYYKVVVFAEDNLYLYNTYEEIDASEGVIMYTYFKMKPINVDDDEENKGDVSDNDQKHDGDVSDNDQKHDGDVSDNDQKHDGDVSDNDKKPGDSDDSDKGHEDVSDNENKQDDIDAPGNGSQSDNDNQAGNNSQLGGQENAGNRDGSGVNLGTKTPQTGDENNLLLWIGLAILAVFVIVAGALSVEKRDKAD